MGDFDDLIKDFSGFINDKTISEMVFFSRISSAFRDYFNLENSFPIAPYTWGVLDCERKVITLFLIGNSINHQFKCIYKMRGLDEPIKINSMTLLKESHIVARLNNKIILEEEIEEYVIPFYCLELGYDPYINSTPSLLEISLGAQVEINWINAQVNLVKEERVRLIQICSNYKDQLDSHNSILMEELNCLWQRYIKESKSLGDKIEYSFSLKKN